MIVALVVLVPLAGLAVWHWWPRRPRPSDSLAVIKASMQHEIELVKLAATLLTDARPVGDSTAGRPLPARSATPVVEGVVSRAAHIRTQHSSTPSTTPSCPTCGDKGWISAPGEACSFLERVVPCPFCDGPEAA